MRQFTDISTTCGAPMGRDSYGLPSSTEDKSISLFRVRFVEGEAGEAYWGGGRGVLPLWCARDREGDYQGFTRANSRVEAMRNLGIPPVKLARIS